MSARSFHVLNSIVLALTWTLAAAADENPTPPGQAPTESHTVGQSTPSPALALPPGAVQTLAELPPFQPGLWRYRRSVETGPHAADAPEEISKCSDPGNDIKRKMTEMQRKGCRIVGMTQIGNRFRSAWSCLVDDEALTVSNVITAESATSYQDLNESHYREQSTRTVVVATRVGDCSPAAQ